MSFVPYNVDIRELERHVNDVSTGFLCIIEIERLRTRVYKGKTSTDSSKYVFVNFYICNSQGFCRMFTYN